MSATDPAERDVVLITVDSLQYDYVADDDQPASHLDAVQSLADDGAFFTDAFSNASITKASFLSIFSGTYPWMFESIPGGFGSERPHIAELFSEAGYTTAGFNTNPYLSTTYGYDRGFDYYMGRDTDDDVDRTTLSAKYWPVIKETLPSKRLSDAIRSAYGLAGEKLGIQLGGDPYVPAEQVNDAVLEWIRGTSGPRFIWIHYMDVHTPYYPRPGTDAADIGKREAVKLFHKVNNLGTDASEEDLARLERLYEGEVEHFDRRLGDLLDGLAEHVDLDDSVIALASDHGEAFGGHGAVLHPDGMMYDELLHVPLIVSGPGFDAGTVSTPASNVDLVPTLLSSAGADTPPVCVGEDLSKIVSNPPDQRLVFAEGYNRETGRVMVTSGTYKLIHHLSDGSERLYDRKRDPEERHDLIDDPPEVYETLRAAVDDHVQLVRNHDADPEDVAVDEDVKTQLRMLGYSE